MPAVGADRRKLRRRETVAAVKTVTHARISV